MWDICRICGAYVTSESCERYRYVGSAICDVCQIHEAYVISGICESYVGYVGSLEDMGICGDLGGEPVGCRIFGIYVKSVKHM